MDPLDYVINKRLYAWLIIVAMCPKTKKLEKYLLL